MSRRSQPRALAEILAGPRAVAEPATLLAAVQGCWQNAVGARSAQEASPVRERDGVITIACRAATWAQELDLLQNDLLARVNRELEDRVIAGFRFVVASASDFSS